MTFLVKHSNAVRAGDAKFLLLRLLLAVVFLYAGITKLLQPPQSFADSIDSFQLLPAVLVSLLALTLPPFEVLLGAVLLLNRPRRLGAFGALLLLVVFLFALITAFFRGLAVDCGCFGGGAVLLPLTTVQRMWWDLTRDLLLAAAALMLYRRDLIDQTSQASA